MTEDTHATTLGDRPADDPAGRGAGVPGPAAGLEHADVVTALVEKLTWTLNTLVGVEWDQGDVEETLRYIAEIIAAVRADAALPPGAARLAEAYRIGMLGHGEALDRALAEVAGLRSLAEDILDDLYSARGYIGDYFWDKWYADDYVRYRGALAPQPAAPKADPERCEGADAVWPHGDFVKDCWVCRCIAAVRADAARAAEAEVAGLRNLLDRAIESLHDAERELHVWVDRDRERHPGWSDVGYEPWNNKPSLALWSVGVYEIETALHALAAQPAAPEKCCCLGGRNTDCEHHQPAIDPAFDATDG